MTEPESSEARYAEAEVLLAHFATQTGADDPRAFEVFLAAHPRIVNELRELRGQVSAANAALYQEAKRVRATAASAQAMLSDLHAPSFHERYMIDGEVGRGGMGAVLRVIDRKLERPLAMKIILGQVTVERTGKTPEVTPARLARFLREAKLTSQLDHPGIVPVHEIGVDAEGRAYFTMKLVSGRTLAEVFERQLQGDPEFTRARVLSLLLRVCEATSFAHEHGVIHRDLKPANIMVGDFGEVYVMDWGLARKLDARQEVTADDEPESTDPLIEHMSMTRVGQVVGTPAYMPPEQAEGRLSDLGPESDVYALGAMLYQLIAGHPPYCKPGEQTPGDLVLQRIIVGPPGPLSQEQAPPELIAICDKALRREPRERYRTTRELAADLGAFLEGRVVDAYEGGAWAEAKKWVLRNRGFSAAFAGGLIALVVGLIGTSTQYFRAEEERKAALRETAIARKEAHRAVSARHFLESTLQAGNPVYGNPADLPLRAVLDRSAAGVEREFASDPDVRGILQTVMADAYLGLGLMQQSLDCALAAVASLRLAGEASKPQLARALYILGEVTLAKSATADLSPEEVNSSKQAFSESMLLYEQLGPAYAISSRAARGSLVQLDQLASGKTADRAGRWPASLVFYMNLFWHDSDTNTTIAKLEDRYERVIAAWRKGDHEAAKAVMRADFAGYLDTPEKLEVAGGFLQSLGRGAQDNNEPEIAECAFSLGVDIFEDSPTPNLTYVLTMKATLGGFMAARNRWSEASEICEPLLPAVIAQFGPEHESTFTFSIKLCRIRSRLGEHDRARALVDSLIDLSTKRPDHLGIWRGALLATRADLDESRGDLTAAAASLRELIGLPRKKSEQQRPGEALALHNLSRVLFLDNQLDLAASTAETARSKISNKPSDAQLKRKMDDLDLRIAERQAAVLPAENH